MKIVFFTDTYMLQINGVVSSIDSYSKELRRRGHDVYNFCPRSPEYNIRNKYIQTCASTSFKSYPGYRIGAPLVWMIKDVIKTNGFDIIHSHSPASMGFAGLYMSRHCKIPLIASYHTHLPDYAHYIYKSNIKLIEKLTKKFIWKVCRYYYNRANHVITPSEGMRNILRRHGIKKPMTVIPTGIEIKKISTSKKKLREKYNIARNKKIILHVGRITREKNIPAIIKAVKDTDTDLYITSGGPYMEKIKELVHQENMDEKIKFLGFVSRKKLDELYRLSDAFIMASKTETQGLVLLEAIRGGLPIVVLKAPVIADFVKQNKIGYVASNVRDMSKKINMVVKNGNFKEQQKQTLEKYDIRKLTDDLVRVYESQ